MGEAVQFSLPARPLSVSLQGLVQSSGGWKNLRVKLRPRQDLGSIQIPRKWRDARLRVVATYKVDSGERIQIDSEVDGATHAVLFTSSANARLYSVESKSRGSGFWARVSTVAAPETPRSIRVALPSSVASDADVRVMEISGTRQQTYPALGTPVSSWLRSGPSVFPATSEVVSGTPLASVQASVQADSGRLGSQAPTVEESDIWKIRGKLIYFFNLLRGLQIIDATDPANPVMSGTLPLAGSGEEMYLLGSGQPSAALLITALPWNDSTANATRLNLLNLQGENPVLESSLDLPGRYVESRLVGGTLQVVTSSSDVTSGRRTPKTYITAVDVSQDGVLAQSPPFIGDFSPAQVGSTAKYLWVAGDTPGDWASHTLYAFPLKFDGSLDRPLQAVVGGRIFDKFKVGDTTDGIAVVVQNWAGWQQSTSVETYGVNDGILNRRGKLELVRNESLFATRFDGDRLYVVTFQQKDPLWIVDMSDPESPAIKSHLEVPGWSSFIQPVGDTLAAVGRDEGKVQVSLFDVSDAANPTLAQRVDVGSGWSWSEAEWNEKAVKIMPEAGLILIPVVEWDGGVRKNRVSLIDFDASQKTLSLRGTIDHEFAPRRAALMEDHFVASVSNRELLLVDASDRDAPQVASNVTLAFGVDRVLVRNGIAFMFEHGEGFYSGGPDNAVLRTASVDSIEDVSSQISLPCRRVAAAKIIGDRLVVVESSSSSMFLFASDDAQASSNDSALSVWSLPESGAPELIGRVALPFSIGSDAAILPVDGGRIAVCSREQGWNYWVRTMPVALASGNRTAVAADSSRYAMPWLGWGGQGLHVGIAQVSGETPAVLGSWDLSGSDYSGISEVFSARDLLVFSYDHRERQSAGVSDGMPVAWPDDWSGWSRRSWLQIVDLADPSAPMPWAPVQLPGQLTSVSWLQRAGGVLFARSSIGIAAIGFDGENASLIAEVPVDGVFTMEGPELYLANTDGVAEWKFSERDARWEQGTGWSFQPDLGIGELHVNHGAVLAGAHGLTSVLGENGSVSSYSLPGGADIGSAEAIGAGLGFVVPASDYGAVLLH